MGEATRPSALRDKLQGQPQEHGEEEQEREHERQRERELDPLDGSGGASCESVVGGEVGTALIQHERDRHALVQADVRVQLRQEVDDVAQPPYTYCN